MKVLRGTVVSGRREAAGFVALSWVVEQLEEQARISPYPGTLNLKLTDEESLALWGELRQGGAGLTLVPRKTDFCSASCFFVRINDEVPGVIVWPHVESYPSDVVEVVAGENLRKRLGLRDGDSCTLRVQEQGDSPRFGCVLFDLEGTVVDFQWKLEPAEAELRAALGEIGFDPALFARDNYAAIRHRALELTGSPELRAEIDRQLNSIYDRYDLDAESRWSLRDGAKDLFRSLRAQSIALGLVTNIGRLATDKALGRLGLASTFDVVVTRNDVEHMKPKGEGIRNALKALGSAPDNALMVGDSLSDLLAARDAGTRVALVTGGESEIRGIGEHRPDYTVPSLRAVRDLVLPEGTGAA